MTKNTWMDLKTKQNAWQEQSWLKEYGWYMHHVIYKSTPYYVNMHTHGLKESFAHTDLQIVLAIDPAIAHALFREMIEKIKNGYTFSIDTRHYDVIEHYAIEVIQTMENDREVLRVLLPDPDGFFPNEEACDIIYKHQQEWQPHDLTFRREGRLSQHATKKHLK